MDLGWMLDDFGKNVPGTQVAIAVSADGLLIAQGSGMSVDDCETLAALTASVAGVGRAAAIRYGTGAMHQVVIQMEGGTLLVTAVGQGANLAVLTTAAADIATVGYELGRLARRSAEAIMPPLRT